MEMPRPVLGSLPPQVTRLYPETVILMLSPYLCRCLGVDPDKVPAEQFRCRACETGVRVCGICGEAGPEKVTRCHAAGCGRWYHAPCLAKYTLWPQHKLTNGHIYCPAHTCHTCASDNPKDPVMKYNEKLMHCVRCPTAYHTGDHCVAAGTIQLTKTDIICPKHYKPAPKTKKGNQASHINTNWCFICSAGGNLVCCDRCPTSIHEECMGTGEVVGDKYYCDNCQSGESGLGGSVFTSDDHLGRSAASVQ